MKHHRKRGRRVRRRGFRGRAQAGAPAAGGGGALGSVAVSERPEGPADDAVAHPPEPPNLDAMVSALLEAEAHAAEEKAHALAEAQAHMEALEVRMTAEAPAIAEDEAADGEAEDDHGHARAHRRSVINRAHTTPVRTRQRIVYVGAGIVVVVLVIAVLSWMEWWDLSAVSLLPAPQ